jgi:hypothetical protein
LKTEYLVKRLDPANEKLLQEVIDKLASEGWTLQSTCAGTTGSLGHAVYLFFSRQS